ncbi:MAG: histidine phosphatase family protein [Mycobacteriales bacterium]
MLWRHGQTAWNLQRRYQGSTDVPLDEVGVEQANRGARLLAALRPAMLVSSPLLRARASAGALAEVTDLEVIVDDRLVERGGGAWEGLTDAEIRSRFPSEYAVWQPADGETPEQVEKRVVAAVEDALSELPDQAVLVVASHGAAIRFGLAGLLEMPQEYVDRLGPLGNCSWSLLERVPYGRLRGGWRVAEHNAGTLPTQVLSDDH